MKIKPGVRVLGLRSEMVLAALVINSVLTELGIEFVITSCIEGTHKHASLHYMGSALDIRLPPPTFTGKVIANLKEALGDDYDVILEDDHIHIEFQPKSPY